MSPLLPVYRRSNRTIVRGEGVYLFDDAEHRYLDFATGIAVNALGHVHQHVTNALKAQADTLWHCSNMYYHPELLRFAARLTRAAGMDKIFFGSSGSEAVECALKLARKFSSAQGKYRIITMSGGFHGRSLACISAGGNEIARSGYTPLLEGFDRVAFNDLSAVERAITSETAAILIEPVQGEGGVVEAKEEFLRGVRALCDAHGLLLIFDEVQCGMGRLGTLFAYETFGVRPDIVTVAKGIGNGFPLSACLTTDRVSACMTPGAHGSTYGANPLAMAVGNAVLDVMEAPDFFPHMRIVAGELKQGLEQLAADFPKLIREVRGRGFLLGVKMNGDHRAFVEELREARLLTAPAEDQVIRILPPLIASSAHVAEALAIFTHTLKQWNRP